MDWCLERWVNEAFWFGHGRVQPGLHLVEYMPIGSHHTWWRLLFVKGVVGMLALLVPFVWQTLIAIIDAAKGPRGRLPMGIMMTLTLLFFWGKYRNRGLHALAGVGHSGNPHARNCTSIIGLTMTSRRSKVPIAGSL